MKVAIIHTEDNPKWLGKDFVDFFVDTLKLEDVTRIELATKDDPLPDANSDYDAVIITGSHYDVRNSLPWYTKLENFLRSNIDDSNSNSESKKPMIFGSCFGAQIIGHAFGGKVDTNPGYFVCKAEEITLTNEGVQLFASTGVLDKDKLLTAPTFRVLESHGDQVLELPKGATLLASSQTCKNEMFLVGKNILAVQSHPEFDVEYAIKEKIWPYLSTPRSPRFPEDIAKEAEESFTKQLDHEMLLNFIRGFLERKRENS
jgi:GMP synthase-like glutamine amidotransferase